MSENTDGKEALQKVVSKQSAVLNENIGRCVEWMREGIEFGKSWKIDTLANQLNMEPKSIQFSMAMSEVNKALEREGYHLTTRGKHGQEYFVESIDRSSKIGASMNSDALRMFKRAVVYLHGVSSNHADKLTESQKRKIEKQAEVSALRYVLASRIR
jgi:hypothetical protein